MSRINIGMSLIDLIVAMVDGNPGAISVLTQLMKEPESIGPILDLDTHEIYGSEIWMLYKDVCKQDIRKTIGVLDAVRHGRLSLPKLKHAIQHYGEGIDVNALTQPADATSTDG